MFASRITISKETQEKQKKSMSKREKGRVLLARLQELEADGTLSKAKTRADVARLVGYPEERAKAGYSWVSNLISRGHISETIREWAPSGKTVAEYHVTGSTPDGWMKQQEQMPILTENKTIKIEITRSDMTIKVEMDSHEEASKLITTIIKGE